MKDVGRRREERERERERERETKIFLTKYFAAGNENSLPLRFSLPRATSALSL